MASAKLTAALAILALLQVSCAVARHHGKPAPCEDDDVGDFALLPGGGMRHNHHAHHRQHHCTPASTSRHGGTPAVMTVNGFRRGESGGGASACDGHFHDDGEMVVALSSRWYAHGHRCHRKIRITSARDGRTVEATVVDECDSQRGCRDNIVDSSPAVWRALGLDTDAGVARVTWSDV